MTGISRRRGNVHTAMEGKVTGDRDEAWSQEVPAAGRGPGITCPPEGIALPTFESQTSGLQSCESFCCLSHPGCRHWVRPPGAEYRGHLGQGGGTGLSHSLGSHSAHGGALARSRHFQKELAVALDSHSFIHIHVKHTRGTYPVHTGRG